MSPLREHLHRFWFRFDRSAHAPPSWTGLGCGVTAVDRSDAEALLAASVLARDGLPPMLEVIEDVDVQTLDLGMFCRTWVMRAFAASGSRESSRTR